MGIISILALPWRAASYLVATVVHLLVTVLLAPFRLAHRVVQSILDRFHAFIHWTQYRLSLIKGIKPFVYIFSQDTQGSAAVELSPVIDIGNECSSDEEVQSIPSIIEDLIALSQQTQLQKQKVEPPKQKLHQLIQELQELAIEQGIENDNGRDSERGGGEGGVPSILADLNNLENYLLNFLEEEDPTSIDTGGPSTLETIMEETASKETSPIASMGSPVYRGRMKSPGNTTIQDEEMKLMESQGQISQTLLMLGKVTNSQELRETLEQLADMHGQSTHSSSHPIPPSSPDIEEKPQMSDSSRRDSMKKQLIESQNEMDDLISSLDQQQELMASQLKLQEAMDSLNTNTITSGTPPEDDEIYDSLTPLYTQVDKRPHPPETLLIQEEIYDSIVPVSEGNLTPPSLPQRRPGSSASTDSSDDVSIGGAKDHSSDEEDHHPYLQKQKKKNRRRSGSPMYFHPKGFREAEGWEKLESGYESKDSPHVKRRTRRVHSDSVDSGTPPTPRSKRGFLNFFGKKSGSLTSLSSTKSDYADRSSISSYKF